MSHNRGNARLLGIAAVFATSATVVWRCGLYAKDYFKVKEVLQKLKDETCITRAAGIALQAELRRQLERGLAKEDDTRLLMLPSYMTRLPHGKETGRYLSVDLGGTRFRMLHIVFGQGQGEVTHKALREMDIPEALFTGTSAALFEFMARSLVEFAREEGLVPSSEQVDAPALPPVGFCFSFPMSQESLNSGRLLRWTKAFGITDGVGCDPAEALSTALAQLNFPARVVALLNDTIGCFAAACYEHPDTMIGLILGTGTNACYVESVARVRAMHGGKAKYSLNAETVVNTEWGDFDSSLIPRCKEDKDLDAASVRPGEMVFEKMVSGMYLGECSRRILASLVKEAGLLTAAEWTRFELHDSFPTQMMSAIDADDSYGQEVTITMLMKAFGLHRHQCSWTLCMLVKGVVDAVAVRAAKLVALGVSALVAHMRAAERSTHLGRLAVAVDGGTYKNYGKLRERIHAHLTDYLRHEPRPSSQTFAAAYLASTPGSPAPALVEDWSDSDVRFVDCNGGSVVGAAVLAAVATSRE